MKPLKRLHPLPLFSGKVSEYCIIFKVFLSQSTIFPSLFTKNLQFFTPRYQHDRCPQRGLGQGSSMLTTHVSAPAASRFHWHKPRRRKRRRVHAKPIEHKPDACSCCSAEHRTPFQSSAVISPPRDEVLLVHMHIFDYAKPETWLKAI